MFKDLLFFLDKPSPDALDERIERELISKKYWFALGGSIVLSIMTVFFTTFTMIKRKNIEPPEAVAVQKINGQYGAHNIITLPYPHQSLKNITNWLKDAISATYSFNFRNFNQQIENAEYYFTPEGYATYLNALSATKIQETVLKNKLEISIIPLQEPVMINGGTRGDTEFWRFRVPALTSTAAGKEPIVQKYMIEVLILRVPAHKNHKGLGIAEFNMRPL